MLEIAAVLQMNVVLTAEYLSNQPSPRPVIGGLSRSQSRIRDRHWGNIFPRESGTPLRGHMTRTSTCSVSCSWESEPDRREHSCTYPYLTCFYHQPTAADYISCPQCWNRVQRSSVEKADETRALLWSATSVTQCVTAKSREAKQRQVLCSGL